jgi:hypothetical protein
MCPRRKPCSADIKILCSFDDINLNSNALFKELTGLERNARVFLICGEFVELTRTFRIVFNANSLHKAMVILLFSNADQTLVCTIWLLPCHFVDLSFRVRDIIQSTACGHPCQLISDDIRAISFHCLVTQDFPNTTDTP